MTASDVVYRVLSSRGPAVVAVALTLLAAGCASGPADFLNLASDAPARNGPAIRSEAQQRALASALASQGQVRAGQAVGGADSATLMALTVMRQQQNEEARALLLESGVVPAASADAATTCAAGVDCPTAGAAQ